MRSDRWALFVIGISFHSGRSSALLLPPPTPRRRLGRILFSEAQELSSSLETEVKEDEERDEEQEQEPERNEEEDRSEFADADSVGENTNSFLRDERWLENATAKFLHGVPLSSMGPDDVVMMKNIMAGWARRGKPIYVEQLLKRIVDAMKEGNTAVNVSTRLYAIAMDAWAKSGDAGAANRAQMIHDTMVGQYRQSLDPMIKPSLISYSTLMNVWAKSTEQNAILMAEKVLEEMLAAYREGDEELKPDAGTIGLLIFAYSKKVPKNAVSRVNEIFELMKVLQIPKGAFVFGSLQYIYARTCIDAPELIIKSLDEMHGEVQAGNQDAKPRITNYNALINAYCKNPTTANLIASERVLRKMILPVSEGGYHVEPNRMSYTMVLFGATRCPNPSVACGVAGRVLKELESRAEEAREQTRSSSRLAPQHLYLDTACYNAYLSVLVRNNKRGAVDMALGTLSTMERLADLGHRTSPNQRSFNLVLNTMAGAPSSRDTESVLTRATELVDKMWALYAEGKSNLKPDLYTFSSMLQLHRKSSHPAAAKRADNLLMEMERMYEEGQLESPPDVIHYTIVCSAWACSKTKMAVSRCAQILAHMMERHKSGYPNSHPSIRTYNAFLAAMAESNEGQRAEQVLYYLIDMAKKGNTRLAPDSFTFNNVIEAHAGTMTSAGGLRAESVLERMIQYSKEDDPKVQPNVNSFSPIIYCYSRSPEPDAIYRGESVLGWMVDVWKTGEFRRLEVKNMPFSTLMGRYIGLRLPDGGERAERLLQQMKKLIKESSQTKLVIDTKLINSVMMAWVHSGHKDAARKVEIHLDNLERNFEAGNDDLRPTTKSYGLSLMAWSRSPEEDKGRRALHILRRMQRQAENGNKLVKADSFAYSLVINACCFSDLSSVNEMDLFSIATKVLHEMSDSEDTQPNVSTFTWYFQLCSRLSFSSPEVEKQIAKSFRICCVLGLLDDILLHRVRRILPLHAYRELLLPALKDPNDTELLLSMRKRHLPPEWSRNAHLRPDEQSLVE